MWGQKPALFFFKILMRKCFSGLNGHQVAECSSLLCTAGMGTEHLQAALAEHWLSFVHLLTVLQTPTECYCTHSPCGLAQHGEWCRHRCGGNWGRDRRAGSRLFCCWHVTEELSSPVQLARTSVANQDLCQGLPAICWQIPWEGWSPGGSSKRKASCGLVASLWPETMLCFSSRTKGQGPVRVMIPAGEAEVCITVQPICITPSLWLGCRRMWLWQKEALKCLICHCLTPTNILMPTPHLCVQHLPTSNRAHSDPHPTVSLFSPEF